MSRALLLLAAGQSSRWGRPKALLPWGGDVLVNHLARAALAVGDCTVWRVLGAHAPAIHAAAPAPPGLREVFNPAWSAGMGASIACGLRAALAADPALAAVLILPCDLPRVSTELLAALLAAAAERPERIAQCDYGEGAHGPPVAFGRAHFAELLALRGDEGGRAIVRRHLAARVLLPFPEGKWDLDTPADLERFLTVHPA
jgi:molybdenum cofactor cytidylyltransferase